MTSPPVVDFSNFLSGDSERMNKCAAEIRHACRTQGFFQIINHPIPRSIQREIFKLSKQFFALPLEEKMKLDKCISLSLFYGHSVHIEAKSALAQPRTITTAATKSCTAR